MQISGRPRLVMWEITRACKLSCLHCPAGAQQKRSQAELSTYEAYKTIDQIAALGCEDLIISGGDPLERPDLIQLIDYARRRGLRPSLSAAATPNLTGAMVGKLRASGLVSIAISVDSAVRDRHDARRGVPGLFTSTLMVMRWVRTAGLPLEIDTLVTKENVDELETIGSLVRDLEARRWNVYFPVPVGRSKQIPTLSADEAENVFERLATMAARAPFSLRTFEAPHYARYIAEKALRDHHDLASERREALAVDAAIVDRRDILFISHTGEVSISPFLPLAAGNVRYQPLTALYRLSEILAALRDDKNLRGKCGRCEYRSICGGSRARAYATAGDLFAADPLCGYQPGNLLAAAGPSSEVQL